VSKDPSGHDPFIGYDAQLDSLYEQAEKFCEEQATRQLDAYGHMTWSVGDEDYSAYLDAVLAPDGIAYHVVINCESPGCWIDTVEKGIEPIDQAEKLKNLPYRYADTCLENDVAVDQSELDDCARRWAKHIDDLVAEAEASNGDAELRKAALNRGQP
jgi:hypothetical protein